MFDIKEKMILKNIWIKKNNIIYASQRALGWLKRSSIPEQGIIVNSKKRISYAEVTGYFIPTLYQWGEKDLARTYVRWLIAVQNKDGSFSATDGVPYTFDTGQVIRGFTAALGDVPEIEVPLRKACDWVLTQIQQDGRMTTPSISQWSNKADERIHLYVLPGLIEAGKLLNEAKYIQAAQRALFYYKNTGDIAAFNLLSHFHAYIIEALCDLGETDLAKKGLSQAFEFQKKSGAIPAYRNVSWVCSTGIAQYAVVGYKLGERCIADLALTYMEKLQKKSGGFHGSYGLGANYFPAAEISWAVKYFLDAIYWKVKSSFNEDVLNFPDSIPESDGRVRSIFEFGGCLDNKKVLDAGCGKGRFLRILKKKYPQGLFFGLDISEEMLCSCPDGVEKKCGSILDIRYPDGFFDFVYSIEALEHAVAIENAVREMIRILKPGGKLLIIDKNEKKLGHLQLAPWEQWFNVSKMQKLLEECGLLIKARSISYGESAELDDLFIAWEGIKDA